MIHVRGPCHQNAKARHSRRAVGADYVLKHEFAAFNIVLGKNTDERVKIKVVSKLDDRNAAAHPSGCTVMAKVAWAYVDGLVENVLLKFAV